MSLKTLTLIEASIFAVAVALAFGPFGLNANAQPNQDAAVTEDSAPAIQVTDDGDKPSAPMIERSSGEADEATNRLTILEPVRISIESIGVDDVPIVEGTINSNREFTIENHVVGWYEAGSRPGEAGSTLLAAHVSWNGEDGPFRDLASVGRSDRVTVEDGDGIGRTYVVSSVELYNKYELPLDQILSEEGPDTLTLVTCGGRFNEALRSYESNVVVTATRVGAEPT